MGKHLQIICLEKPDNPSSSQYVQVHSLTATQYNKLTKDKQMRHGTIEVNGKNLNYIGFAEYLASLDVDQIMQNYQMVKVVSSYQPIEVQS